MMLSSNDSSHKYGTVSLGADVADSEIGFDDDEHYPLDRIPKSSSRSPYIIPIIVFIAVVSMMVVFIASRIASKHSSKALLAGDENDDIKTSDKPHIILFLADDLAWNSMGYIDETLEYLTPTMTSLAKQGIIMDNFYAQEVCTPSRASLLTGRYPLSVGMQYGMVAAIAEWGLSLDETILPQILKKESYATHLIGKWHLGHYSNEYLPTARGFDSFTGFLNGENYYWSKRSPDYDDYVDFMVADEDCYRLYTASDKHDYSTNLYTSKALDIINDHPKEQPLFLLMSYQAVHDPFIDFNNNNEYKDGIPDSYLPEDVLTNIKENILGFRRQEYMKSLYLMDQSMETVQQSLVDNNMMDNTYVIFISDNGGCVFGGGKNGPLRGSKGALFEGGVKVNSFIYSPLLKLSEGQVYHGLMHISDWFPTILSLVNIPYKPSAAYSLDGVDHLPAWKSKVTVAPRKTMLYNMYVALTDFDFDIWEDGSFAIRDERYKLMHTYNDHIYGATYDPGKPFSLDDDHEDLESRCAQQFVLGDFTVS
jgi:arylsulfatase A-like enzyme